MKNYIRVILFVIMLLSTGCARKEFEDIITIKIKNDYGDKIIKSWATEDGQTHVFLPSYCTVTDMDINLKEDVDPIIHQSQNVATLYIDTESGNMDQIHEDKEHRETAEVMLFTSDGVLDYSNSHCSLKGRGNTTWDLFQKKPYQLKLDESADLLGMGEGKKWILLANAFDSTNLRNKLIYDLARQQNICYAPECEYVDLYLNGEYRGLYLLTERVEFGDDRLNLDHAEDVFMCNIEYALRWDSLDQAFLTEYGRAMEIREPDEATEHDVKHITSIVQNMENAILFPNENIVLSDVIDIDSWVYKYLIDEIMENGDADIASSYFYYKDGMIYAGPLWDYDNTLGISTRNQNPYTFLARSGYHSINNDTPYYDALYKNQLFYDRMTEMYQEEILPALNNLINTDIHKQAEQIAKASAMNMIRWEKEFKEQNIPITDENKLIHYLENRICFLNSAWIDGADYCTVQFEPYVLDMYATEETYATSYAVKRGERFSDLSIPKITDKENVVWIKSETGEAFDPNQIITEDMTLLMKRD